MSLQYWILTGAIAVVAVIAVMGLSRPVATIVDGSKVDVRAIAQAVYDQVKGEMKVGASSGPDRFPPDGCESISGLKYCSFKQGLVVATTSVCSIKSPAATSTLTYHSISETTSSSTASTITIARGANTTATTSILGTAITVGALAYVHSVGTSTGASAANLFPPNTFLNFGQSGGIGTFSPVGTCEAQFTVL